MKMKLKWHKFLCKMFGHRWFYYEEKIDDNIFPNTWQICERCAETKRVLFPPEHPNCRCVPISFEGGNHEDQNNSI